MLEGQVNRVILENVQKQLSVDQLTSCFSHALVAEAIQSLDVGLKTLERADHFAQKQLGGLVVG